ncbi:MAG: AmmeMemoRadiSam system radical SAM enzyme [Elusimicrobiaceae bacterium]|nr:AmmeMemoRadiSam system radical SAM enzyme [Elusimicrobiaceae bacterium]
MEKTAFDGFALAAGLCLAEENGKVSCQACAHACVIADGARGVCGARFNSNGTLHAPSGYVAALAADPVEKKPFYHFHPGALTLSFGMPGCNFSCRFCQNHELSQNLRAGGPDLPVSAVTPEKIAGAAVSAGAAIIVSTYNEPFISCEWGKEVFIAARAKGLKTAFVSNGFASEKSARYIMPFLDACNIDLKCFSDRTYREIIGGRLEPVLDTIRLMWEAGVWVEVTTLVIPDLNDSDAELAQTAGFCAGISPEMPWHVTAFHPACNMRDKGRTPAATLARAAGIGRKAGLKYVYTGNIAGGQQDTLCPHCHARAIERDGFAVVSRAVTAGGCCAACGGNIAGRFSPV